MAAATYPAEPDATKALDYQSVIALAQPYRVDGDPVSSHERIMGVLDEPRFAVGRFTWAPHYKRKPGIAIELDDAHGAILLTEGKARRLVKSLQRELDRLAPLPPQ